MVRLDAEVNFIEGCGNPVLILCCAHCFSCFLGDPSPIPCHHGDASFPLSALSWVLSFPSACRVCLYLAQASCCVPDTATCFQGWSSATGPSLPLCGFRPGAHEKAHLPLGSETKTMWPRRLSSLPPGDSLSKIQGHSCMVQTPIGIRLPSCSLGFCNPVLLKVVRSAGVTSLGMFIEMHILWPPLDLLNQKL